MVITDNNQIKDNKTENQTVYVNNDGSHTITKRKNSNSSNSNNSTNNNISSNNNNDNIKDTIAPNSSENEPPYESTGEWKKETTLITPNPSEKEPPN